MRKTVLLPLFFIILSSLACQADTLPGYIDPNLAGQTATPALSQLIAASPQSTSTPIPTSTLNYQETAVIANQTSVASESTLQAANVVIAQITAAHEANILAQSQIDAAVVIAKEASDLAAVNATASVYPTALYLTTTAESGISTQQSENKTATVEAPALMIEAADSKARAEQADNIIMADLIFKWVLIILVVLLSIFMAVGIYKNVLKPQPAKDDTELQIPDELRDMDIIPLNIQTPHGGWTARRAEIICSVAALLEFADGIINRKLPPSINTWDKEGKLVNRDVLKEIRVFLIEAQGSNGEKFAKLIRGEVDILDPGKSFLRECLDLGSPPPPFKCIG